MFPDRHSPEPGRLDLVLEVFHKICTKDPHDRSEAIQWDAIQVLVPVKANPLLGRAHSQKGSQFDILIHAIDIGVSVVDDIMLLFPKP